jgi:outer membrane protein
VRDQAVLALRQNNLRVLNEQLRAAQDRFEGGEVTKTDVAQARARVAGATSQISAARANLQASRATYAQLIGKAPGTLRDPGPAKLGPRSLEDAIQVGEAENPNIIAQIFRERAQDHLVKQTKGELLPSVDLQANYTLGTGETSSNTKREEVTTITGVVRVPIYQAGEVSARIRQNIETRSQIRFQIDEARESVRANIISAWGVLVSARAQITSDQAQVDANQVALAGVREEEKVGQRTVLEVLNAEQELLNFQVDLATSRRNLAVASYALLAAVGRLSINTLGLPVEQYDPTQYYRQVKNKWGGWGAAYETSTDPAPVVAPVTATGREPGQPSGDGPAYTGSFRDVFAQ